MYRLILLSVIFFTVNCFCSEYNKYTVSVNADIFQPQSSLLDLQHSEQDGAGTLSGFGYMFGPSVDFGYFFSKNFGLAAGVQVISGNDNSQYDGSDLTHKHKYDSTFINLGVMGRIVGDLYPFELSVGAGFSRGEFSLEDHQSGSTPLFWNGSASPLGLYFSVDTAFPVWKFIAINVKLLYRNLTGDIKWSSDNGEKKHKNVNLGGMSTSFGLKFLF